MMSNKGDIEEKLICPLDKSHHILKHRMQAHLVKCKRNHPDTKTVQCPFNNTHLILEPLLQHHASECPDRLSIDKFTTKFENVEGAEKKFPIPKLDVQPTECWDDCEEVPTYNPSEYCKNNPVLRITHTRSAAQRRNFRHEERARMNQFDDTVTKPEAQPLGLETLQKQRRPAVKSAGIQNGKLEVADLMEHLTLNAEVLTTPKVPPVLTPQPAPATDTTNDDPKKNNRLPLDQHCDAPKSAPWCAPNLVMGGVNNKETIPSRSVGRGSFLAKKK